MPFRDCGLTWCFRDSSALTGDSVEGLTPACGEREELGVGTLRHVAARLVLGARLTVEVLRTTHIAGHSAVRVPHARVRHSCWWGYK